MTLRSGVALLVATLPAARRRLVTWGFAGMAACAAGCVLATLAMPVWPDAAVLRDGFVVAAVTVSACLVVLRAAWRRDERAAWASFGMALALWSAGYAAYFFVARRAAAAPALHDVLWLLGYPGLYAGLGMLSRGRQGSRSRALWLDGAMGGLAFAAVAAASVLQQALEAADGDTWTVVPLLAYPLSDMVLGACLVTGLAGGRWHLSRSGWLLGTGLLIQVLADGWFVLAATGAGGAPDRGPWELGWVSAAVLLVIAAWDPHIAPHRRRTSELRALACPVGFAGLALALIVLSAFRELNLAAVLLAAGALALAIVRLLLTLRMTARLAESRRLSMTDELTGLANRRAFLQAAEAAVGRGEQVALLMLDLDQFKELNDTLGHEVGDELLRRIGPRLLAVAPREATVARLGGDEFGVLLAGAGPDRACELAADLRRALDARFRLAGIALQVDASVGIACHPEHGADVTTLLRTADVAMYEAKRLRCGVAVYAPAGDRTSRDRLTLAGELREAIARGELTLRYQPIASLEDGTIRSVEALVRWQHPQRGELAPGAFIGAVERTGLMRDLTRTVLAQAIAQLAAWHRSGRTWRVAVNVSATDLLDLGFVTEVRALLDEHGAPATALDVEVTEGVLLTDPTRARTVLERLRELGVRVALDDFGTGYSSLTHLHRMPVDALKIDRSFVALLAEDPSARAIVRSLVDLGAALELDEVVAEGIEDAGTVRTLAALGCSCGQGYFLTKPLPAEELELRAEGIEAQLASAGAVPALRLGPEAPAGRDRRTSRSA